MKRIRCDLCGKDEALKVVAYALPMRLCMADGCHYLWGFWSFVFAVLPFNGHFLAYERGYPAALWRWLTRWPE